MVVSMVIVEFVVPRGRVRTLAEGALVLAVWLSAMLWCRANRVALDLLEWCDCASTTVSVIVPLADEWLASAAAAAAVPIKLVTLDEPTDEVLASVGSPNEPLADRQAT